MERTNSLQQYYNEFYLYRWIHIHIHHHHHAKQENELQKKIPHKILIPLEGTQHTALRILESKLSNAQNVFYKFHVKPRSFICTNVFRSK